MENILLIAVITLALSIALIAGITVYTYTEFEELPHDELEGENYPIHMKTSVQSVLPMYAYEKTT